MKRIRLLALNSIFLSLLLFSCTTKESPQQTKIFNSGINITPIPLELIENEGFYTLNSRALIVVNNNEIEKIANYFIAKIEKSTGYELKTIHQPIYSNYINLQIVPNIDINNEGYILNVTKNGVTIEAKTNQGLFYGMQTMMQLLPAEIESPSIDRNTIWKIPFVSIKDEPRFSYRGMHLDVSRHFVDITFIKKQLDLMAMFKINRFHWHLTDDQGWRIEIKQYPKLTQIGAKRIEGEGNTYGPHFYTQAQIKEVVAYAKDRFIEIIPEIELPGHAVAAIAAYPELSCTGKQIDVRNYWGVATDVYCAGNDSVFRFLENVLSEIIPLFESEYIHIGGDECPKERWKDCLKCQTRIKELGLISDKAYTAEDKLQSYFVQQIEKYLTSKNKKMIGWNEILEGGLSQTATIMSWSGVEAGVIAANAGHDVIMTPMKWMYADRFQGDSKVLPVTIGGYLPIDSVYCYEPISKTILADKQKHILGIQMNIWTEYKYLQKNVEYDIYPRIIAMSEAAWSASGRKNLTDFSRRINNQLVRLDCRNVNYYIPLPEQKNYPSCNYITYIDSVKLEFVNQDSLRMVYTIDGSEPKLISKVYTAPLVFNEDAILKIRSVLVSNKMSEIRTIEICKQSYILPFEIEPTTPKGLKTEYYKKIGQKLNDFENKKPDEMEYISSPQEAKYVIENYKEMYANAIYSTVIEGHININEDGIYYFSTNDDLIFFDQPFITNSLNNGRARRFSNFDKSIALSKGYHPIKIVRYGGIFGGWPSQWEPITVSIRKENETSFKIMGAEYFY